MEPTAVLDVFCNFMPEKPERSLEAFSPLTPRHRSAFGKVSKAILSGRLALFFALVTPRENTASWQGYYDGQKSCISIRKRISRRRSLGVGAVSQPLIPTGGQSGLLTHIATTVSASLRTLMKS
jgi:hypothetical protein